MELQGTRVLAVTRQQAWDGLNDPEVLKACIPGCERFERGEGDTYDAVVALKIGPVAARFTGKASVSDSVPLTSYALGFEASAGVAGFGRGQAKVRLEPQDGGGCVLHYEVHSQIGGKIAQIGQRLIDGVAKNLSEDFFRRLEAELTQRYASSAAATLPDGTDTTGRDGIPSWLWWVGAVLALLAVWLTLK